MVHAEPLGRARETAALEYLARSPYDHLFLSYLVIFDVARSSRDALYAAVDEHDTICGIMYFGRQVVLAAAADDDATLDVFATIAAEHSGERMIVGPRDTVRNYWKRIRARHTPPRLVRERQLVMKIDRASLRPYPHTVTVRHARIDEWTVVADNSALMIAQELEYDPRRTSPEFTSNVRSMIDRGLWWVGESFGRLCFFCNVGPWTPHSAQLQGIWTPPSMRGKHLATASLAGICDRLLGDFPTLSLYVNDFNTRAIALYERVGFTTVSEFQTMLF